MELYPNMLIQYLGTDSYLWGSIDNVDIYPTLFTLPHMHGCLQNRGDITVQRRSCQFVQLF